MSRGIGITEKKILDILRERYHKATSFFEMPIQELIPLVFNEKPVTTSQKQSIYRAIRTLENKNYITVLKSYDDRDKKFNHRGGYRYSKVIRLIQS